MQVHNRDTNKTAEILAASYLSRKPGLMADAQGMSHQRERMIDEREQAEDVLISTRFDTAPPHHDRPRIVHLSKTYAADAELSVDGSIHLVPVHTYTH